MGDKGNAYNILVEKNLKVKHHLEDTGIDGYMILKLIKKE
jgi:hypothetical protein